MSKTYKKHLENPNFRPLAYICAPYSGDKDLNITRAIHYAELAYKNSAIPVIPHLLFPFKDDRDLEQRKDALFMDIILLGKCQEVWVFGSEITEGMKIEIKIEIRNIVVEIGVGILTFLSILNNNLYSLVIVNSIIIETIISVNISLAEILFNISIGK